MAVASVGTPTIGTTSTSGSPFAGTWGTGQTRTAGNLLVAGVAIAGATASTAIPTPSGWTAAGSDIAASTNARVNWFWKVATGSDTFSITPTFTTGICTVVFWEFTGANTGTPIQTSGTATGTTGTTALTATTSAAVSAAGSYALAIWGEEVATAATCTFTASGTGYATVASYVASSRGHSGYTSNPTVASGSTTAAGGAFSGTPAEKAAYVIVIAPAPAVSASAGNASASGSGNNATTTAASNTNVSGGLGTASGTGNAPTASIVNHISVSAGLATGSGTGNAAVASRPPDVSDAFTRSAGALGGNWTQFGTTGSPVIQSSGVVIGNTATSGAWTGVTWSANSWNATQDASITLGTLNSSIWSAPGVRMTNTGGGNGYFALTRTTSPQIRLFRMDGSALTQLATSTSTPATGGVVDISANGSTISVSYNGVQIMSVTDTTYATGSAGFIVGQNVPTITNWTGNGVVPNNATSAPAGLASGTGRAGGVLTKYCLTQLVTTGDATLGYFADQAGNPVLMNGDYAWALSSNAGAYTNTWQQDYDAYCNTRAAQGFNTVFTKLIGSTQDGGPSDDGNTWDGINPFNTSRDPSSGFNDTYWQRIDYFVWRAGTLGLTCLLQMPGYNYDLSSGCQRGWTTAQWQAYGAGVGARYGSRANIVWHYCDDYFGTFDSQIEAMHASLRAAGDSHAVGVENYPESDSRFDLYSGSVLALGTAVAQYNFVYTYNVTYLGVEQAYAEAAPIPSGWMDGYFYKHTGTHAEDVLMRNFHWWALSSGARSVMEGSEGIWQWTSAAVANLTAEPWYQSQAAGVHGALTQLIGWHKLVPDTSSAFITAGRGTRATPLVSGGSGGGYTGTTDNYVSGAITPDGKLGVVYISKPTTVTINAALLPAGYQVCWMDPANGTLTQISTATTYNSSSMGTNSTGDTDWALVFRSLPGTSANAGLASGAGTANNPTVTVVSKANPTAGAGTGAAQAPRASVSVTAGLATASGTGNAPTVKVAIQALSGLAPATGAAANPTVSISVSTSASAGLAHGTGTGLAVTATLSPQVPPGLAQGTGTAYAATVSAGSGGTVLAGNASGSGAALTVTISTKQSPVAGVAQGAGAAYNPTTSTAAFTNASAGKAAGTGTAFNATVTVSMSGSAAAHGQGNNPTVSTNTTVATAHAGLAAGTGLALQVTLSGVAEPGTITVTLTAPGVSVSQSAASVTLSREALAWVRTSLEPL